MQSRPIIYQAYRAMNINRRYRLEYAGLAEENGNYYLVDGFRMVHFFYDIPEIDHAEKVKYGGQPSMLRFIEDARQKIVIIPIAQ